MDMIGKPMKSVIKRLREILKEDVSDTIKERNLLRLLIEDRRDTAYEFLDIEPVDDVNWKQKPEVKE